MKFTRNKIVQIFQIFLGLFCSFAFCSCNSGYTDWVEDKSINGIEFEKIRFGIKDNDTTVIVGYLKADTFIEQYHCAADWVHFTKEWKLKLFRLGRAARINNYEYSENSWIRFTQDGSVICVFPENRTIQGYKCRGGGGATGISTAFYISGRLHYFFADGDVSIGNVLCKSNLLNNIGLHENGSLKECTLAQDQKIDNTLYRKNTRISFDEGGKVKAIL